MGDVVHRRVLHAVRDERAGAGEPRRERAREEARPITGDAGAGAAAAVGVGGAGTLAMVGRDGARLGDRAGRARAFAVHGSRVGAIEDAYRGRVVETGARLRRLARPPAEATVRTRGRGAG